MKHSIAWICVGVKSVPESHGRATYLPGSDPDSRILYRRFRNAVAPYSMFTDVISSSGPTLIVAPRSLAIRMLCMIRSRFPYTENIPQSSQGTGAKHTSKSIAH